MLFMRFDESRPHSVQGMIQAHFEAMYAHDRNGSVLEHGFLCTVSIIYKQEHHHKKHPFSTSKQINALFFLN